MRVDQAAGGTNHPGVPTDSFAMPAGMRMRYDMAASSLAPYVSGYAIYVADGRASMTNWYLPAPAMITILLDAGPVSVKLRNRTYDAIDRASVWGPTSHAYRTITHGGISVGIGLTAMGWARLTARPADAFRDRVAPLSSLIGAATAAELVQALDALDADAAIAPLLDAMLRRVFASADERAEERLLREVHRLITADDPVAIDEIARRLDIEPRAMRVITTRAFGMTLKPLLTRTRFIRSFATWLMQGEPMSYAGIDSSYFDAAHFLRDAQRYLDTTPRRFARRETTYLKASLRARAAVIGAAAHVLHAAV